jgi:hypothetical protein
MLSEFLSANVSTPFLLFMVEGTLMIGMCAPCSYVVSGFGTHRDEAAVALWTGILGMSYSIQPLLSLICQFSLDILLHPVSDVTALGMWLSYFHGSRQELMEFDTGNYCR